MKKILFVLLMTALFSCEKDAKFCWDCNVTRTTVNPGATVIESGPETKCDMSQAEINAFEQGSTSGNTTTTATCVMQ
jgi:hypothetical protein